MFELMKQAVIARKIQALKDDLSRAGQSLGSVAADVESLKKVPPKTVWQIIHGLDASLEIAEKTLRMARQSEGLPAGTVRQAAGELQHATAHLRELLSHDIVPWVEKNVGLPEPNTRWTITPPTN